MGKQIRGNPGIRLTVTKLSSLQRFILKAAYQNRRYQKKLARASWPGVHDWRDLYNEEVAMLRFGVGSYAGPQPKFDVFGNKLPAVPFNRRITRRRDEASKKLRDKFNASITRAMKRLEDRGLIERITQNHKDIFYSGCNLTERGYKLAAGLVAVTLGQCMPVRPTAQRQARKERARMTNALNRPPPAEHKKRVRITPQNERSSLSASARSKTKRPRRARRPARGSC